MSTDTFGQGKRVMWMDCLNPFEMADREIPLTKILERKVCYAVAIGSPFIRVRDLFPY